MWNDPAALNTVTLVPKLKFCWHIPFTVGINSEVVFIPKYFCENGYFFVFCFFFNKSLIAIIYQSSFNWSKYFWCGPLTFHIKTLFCIANMYTVNEHVFVQTSSSVRVLRTKCKAWSIPWCYFRHVFNVWWETSFMTSSLGAENM